jgi:hypothetical protein
MKRFLLFTGILFSMATFSQTNVNNNVKQNLDNSGGPLFNVVFPLTQSIPDLRSRSAFYYDSIRALTEINSPTYADAYPWISSDGLRLYYTGGANSNALMFTQRANTSSSFNAPVVVPITLTSPTSYWLSKDELDLYVCGNSMLTYAHRASTSSSFTITSTITLTGITLGFFAGASLNTAQDELFLYSAGTTTNIYEFTRTSSQAFAYARTLHLPSGYIPTPGQLSKDDLTFFLGASDSLAYSGKNFLCQYTRTNPTDSFATGTFQQIQNINDTTMWNTQPSSSDSLNWVTFVRSSTNSWSADDIYLAHKGSTLSVFDPAGIKINISVFPNPAANTLTIEFPQAAVCSRQEAIIEITNIQGQLIKSFTATENKTSIDVSALPCGVYVVEIKTEKGIEVKKFIKE